MNAKPLLYILFTMNCEPVAVKTVKQAPKTWVQSARTIEGFCNRLSNMGYPATLFVSATCAEEHGPLLEELAGRNIELGLYVHPPTLEGSRYVRHLGNYTAAEQRAMIDSATERFYDAIGSRPRSFRSGAFSASDATFQVLYELGFRQSSLSIPGRDLPRDAISWNGAETAPHYVDLTNRLHAGTLPFLELPVTSDPDRWYRRGFPYELCIENSGFDDWHRPLIERTLEQQEAEHAPFRSLCLFTHNGLAYYLDGDQHSITIEQLLAYFDTLADRYELVPTTLAGAHQHFRQLIAGGEAPISILKLGE
ncbi:MAG: polysaccharide deacetylase family protein [Roseiflexaceae bacterium]